MTRGTIFWVLMILWLVFGGMIFFGSGDAIRWGMHGSNLLTFVLFGLLGWQVYGPAIKG